MDALSATVAWFENAGRDGNPGQWPTHDGEYYGLCPFHDDEHIGSFSFSERGYKCFSCNAHGSIQSLARRTAKDFDGTEPLQTHHKAQIRPDWCDWDVDAVYGNLPDQARSYYHSRGLSDQTIRSYHLGWGVIPQCRCPHERLVLPIYNENQQLMALKGRALGCDCDRWVQAKGGRPTLFNEGLLRYARGRCVIVTEAPYSAMLGMQDDVGVTVVACCGASTWLPEWTQKLKDSAPLLVVVWYDHDEAGREWGDWVAQELVTAGIPTRLFMWTDEWPEKSDLADYRKGNSVRLAVLGAMRVRQRNSCNPRPSSVKAKTGFLRGGK